MLYWRGSSSGGAVIGQNFHHMQRTRLLDLANARPDMIDAKFTRYVYCNEACEQMEKEVSLPSRRLLFLRLIFVLLEIFSFSTLSEKN